jgi:hypothetical protein
VAGAVLIRKPLQHDPEALRALKPYVLVPAIMAAAEVCNSGTLVDSVDETEQVDRERLSALRGMLVAIGYEYGMVVGR